MSTQIWEKVLWKAQPYPDNYVPSSFLSSLRRNSNFHPYSYLSLVFATCTVVQHLSTIIIFLVTFVRIYDGSWDPRVLVWISAGIFVLGFIIWELLLTNKGAALPTDRAKALKSSILVFMALLGLSPVLRTLTAATSSDSIWALAACLFILNLILADYSVWGVENHTQTKLTSVLSMNAAISSSVVLASRLPDDLSVFALIIYSVQLFTLFPMFRARIQEIIFAYFKSDSQCLTVCVQVISSRVALTASTASVCTYLIMTISYLGAVLIGMIFLLILFGSPTVLVWAQRYKNEIRGPWDVAVPFVR